MQKFLNQALLFKEWKIGKWLFLIISSELLLFKTFKMISIINAMKKYPNLILTQSDPLQSFKWTLASDVDTSRVYLIITIALISIVLMWHERSHNYYTLTASMPFKREEILKHKLIIGNSIITVSYIVNFIIMSLIYLINMPLIGNSFNYWDLPKWLFINILTYMSVFTFFMFVQSAMGSSIFAGISGIILLFVPMALSRFIGSLVEWHTGIASIRRVSSEVGGLFTLIMYNNGSLINLPPAPTALYYVNYPFKLIVLTAAIMTFYLLSIYLYKKSDLGKVGQLFMFKSFETLFIAGFSVCFSFLFVFITNSIVNTYVWGLWMVDLLTFLGLVIGYIISKRIIAIAPRVSGK